MMDEQQLIELGTIETSSHFFVQKVKLYLDNLDDKIKEVSDGRLIGSMGRMTQPPTR